jgi:hypothetical protein
MGNFGSKGGLRRIVPIRNDQKPKAASPSSLPPLKLAPKDSLAQPTRLASQDPPRRST